MGIKEIWHKLIACEEYKYNFNKKTLYIKLFMFYRGDVIFKVPEGAIDMDKEIYYTNIVRLKVENINSIKEARKYKKYFKKKWYIEIVGGNI